MEYKLIYNNLYKKNKYILHVIFLTKKISEL